MISYQEQAAVLPVVGYEGLYEVTSDGEVYSLNYNHTGKRVKLKPKVNVYGYNTLELHKCGKKKYCFVHRLVAEAFIPNPDCKPEVDHINTDRVDNRVENLRWVTRLENQHNPITAETHRDATIKANSRAVYCVELDKVFESATEAARQLRLWQQSISRCCLGELQTTGGCHFRFA